MKKTTKVALVATGATLGGLYLLGRWATRGQAAPVTSGINYGAQRVFGAAGLGNPYAQNPYGAYR